LTGTLSIPIPLLFQPIFKFKFRFFFQLFNPEQQKTSFSPSHAVLIAWSLEAFTLKEVLTMPFLKLSSTKEFFEASFVFLIMVSWLVAVIYYLVSGGW
jgi:hypothetical protein